MPECCVRSRGIVGGPLERIVLRELVRVCQVVMLWRVVPLLVLARPIQESRIQVGRQERSFGGKMSRHFVPLRVFPFAVAPRPAPFRGRPFGRLLIVVPASLLPQFQQLYEPAEDVLTRPYALDSKPPVF